MFREDFEGLPTGKIGRNLLAKGIRPQKARARSEGRARDEESSDPLMNDVGGKHQLPKLNANLRTNTAVRMHGRP